MQTRQLGNTGLVVSEIGMGTWELGGQEWGDIEEEDALDLLRYAFDSGITLYDTADQYGGGRSETLLGQAFVEMKDKVIIATKVGFQIESDGWLSRGGEKPQFNASPEYIRTSAEGSLRRLKRDALDVYQLHSSPPPDQWDGAFETLEVLKSRGLIRAYGMALGSEEAALKAIKETGISVMMLSYNMLEQSLAATVMTEAQAKGVGLIVRQPLASGLLSGQLGPDTVFAEDDYRKIWPREEFLDNLRKVEAIKAVVGDATKPLSHAALQFNLAHPAVSGVVPGMMTPAQVDDGVGASHRNPLDPDIVRKIRTLYDDGFPATTTP